MYANFKFYREILIFTFSNSNREREPYTYGSLEEFQSYTFWKDENKKCQSLQRANLRRWIPSLHGDSGRSTSLLITFLCRTNSKTKRAASRKSPIASRPYSRRFSSSHEQLPQRRFFIMPLRAASFKDTRYSLQQRISAPDRIFPRAANNIYVNTARAAKRVTKSKGRSRFPRATRLHLHATGFETAWRNEAYFVYEFCRFFLFGEAHGRFVLRMKLKFGHMKNCAKCSS